jgi:hypothetical protein
MFSLNVRAEVCVLQFGAAAIVNNLPQVMVAYGGTGNSYPPSADHVANSLTAASSSAPPYPSGDVPALSDHGTHLPSETSTESIVADGLPPVFSPYENIFIKWWMVPVVLAALIAMGAGARAVPGLVHRFRSPRANQHQ